MPSVMRPLKAIRNSIKPACGTTPIQTRYARTLTGRTRYQ